MSLVRGINCMFPKLVFLVFIIFNMNFSSIKYKIEFPKNPDFIIGVSLIKFPKIKGFEINPFLIGNS